MPKRLEGLHVGASPSAATAAVFSIRACVEGIASGWDLSTPREDGGTGRAAEGGQYARLLWGELSEPN